MTPTETLDHLRALTDPTSEQLREASDLALMARGWTERFWQGRYWFISPEGDPQQPLIPSEKRPHPCASIDNAERWMVPEGYIVQTYKHPINGCWCKVWKEDSPDTYTGHASSEPLARTIAGLAATLEGEK